MIISRINRIHNKQVNKKIYSHMIGKYEKDLDNNTQNGKPN